MVGTILSPEIGERDPKEVPSATLDEVFVSGSECSDMVQHQWFLWNLGNCLNFLQYLWTFVLLAKLRTRITTTKRIRSAKTTSGSACCLFSSGEDRDWDEWKCSEILCNRRTTSMREYMLQRDVVRFHSFHRIIRFDHQKGPETRNHVYGEIYMQRTGSRTLSSACDRLAFYVATEKKSE